MPEQEELLKKIKGQTEEQLKDVNSRIEDITKDYTSVVEKATEGLLNKEQLEAALKELTEKAVGFTPDQAKELTENLNKLGVEIQSLKEAGVKNEKSQKSFRDIIEDGLKEADLIKTIEGGGEDKENIREIDFLKNSGRKSTPLVVLKDAVDMTTTASYSGVEVGSPFKTMYDSDKVLIPLNNDIHASQVFPVVNIKTKYFGILIEYTYTDGSATTDEDTAAGLSSVLFKTEEFKVFKINTYFHISEEQLDDVDYLLDELSRLAPDKINTTFDSKVFSSSGDGSTDIKGLYASGNYTAFDSATYTDTVPGADKLDLIGKMKLQASLTNYTPNFVQLHPQFIDEIEGMKDLNENSKFNRTVKYDANGNLTFIKGLRVISSKQIGTDAVMVGSTEAAKIGVRKNMTMIIGLDSDDLTTGMRTVVFGLRAAFGVRQALSFIYTTTAAADIIKINVA